MKPWDHAVELISNVNSKTCKVYPLSISEQAKLNAFLKENLKSGRIRPSKSPMAEVFTVPHVNPLDSTGFLWTPVDSKSNLFVWYSIQFLGIGLDWSPV